MVEQQNSGDATGRRRRRLRLGLTVLLVSASVALSASPAYAEYKFTQQDTFNFTTASNEARAYGAINWFRDDGNGWGLPTFRSQTTRTSFVQLMQPGCLHVQVKWISTTGSTAWPPAVSTVTDSSGWYLLCGGKNAYMYIGGLDHPGKTLIKTCVNLGYSRDQNTPMKSYSPKCMWKY